MSEIEILDSLVDWCRTARHKIGAVDGYDYRSGEEAGLANAQGEIEKRLKALRADAPCTLEPTTWEYPTKLPDIPVGSEREFICAVYRKHSGKVYTFSATYLNSYRLNYEWGCPNEKSDHICDECEDGCPTTGWFSITGADDEGSQYHSLNLRDGDELRGWRALPAWDAAPPIHSAATTIEPVACDTLTVPLEPTDEMVEAGERARMEHTDIYFDGSEVARNPEKAIYEAMLAAAPTTSPSDGEVKPSTASTGAAVVSNDAAREKFRADLAEEHLNQIYDYLGCCRSGSAIICTIKEREAALSTSTPPAAAPVRQCTCHPDDNPPVPCAQKYAYSECVAAAPDQGVREALGKKLTAHVGRLASIPMNLPLSEWNVISNNILAAAAALSRPAPDAAGSEWKDIESAPKDADNIDLWCRNISHGSTDQNRFTGMFINSDGKWEDWHGYVLEPKWRPTHWKRQDAGPIPRQERVPPQPITDAVTIVAPPIPPLLQREWMAQALFEVDAPDHLEWDDAGIDKRERYLALADTAIAKAAVLTGSPRNEREGGAP